MRQEKRLPSALVQTEYAKPEAFLVSDHDGCATWLVVNASRERHPPTVEPLPAIDQSTDGRAFSLENSYCKQLLRLTLTAPSPHPPKAAEREG
ncbi:uncharacterized protein PG986_010033 [Apiospora aurea]|uniref:Uncharacterized protein n=1 Tax=Apiospora aurea TaxID=335848 RepID=A0ABR1Q9E3_9PEZI